MSKTFLDSAGLSTFLNDIKYNYANATDGFIPLKASQLETARSIALSGAVTGSADFDGTAGITINTSVAGSHITNVIEEVQVNGTALTVTDKAVNITVPAATVTDVQTKTTSTGSYATVLDGTVAKIDLSTYALKSDITAVMKFKGTKTSDELTALTGMSTGDTYSIISGGTGTTYKVGSEYAYDGTNWVELGPVIDLSGYVTTSTTINSKALSGNITLDGSDVALSTNYAIASTAAAPAAGDSIDTAVGKLQKEIASIPAATVTDVQTKTSTEGSYTTVLDGTTAKIDLSGYALASAIPSAASSIADNETGYATGDQVYDYVEAHKADAVTITTVKVNGTALTPDANKAVDITVPTAAASIADGATGYATGDQVYDYVEANKGDTNVIEEVKFKGNGDAQASALTVTNKSVTVDVSGYALTSQIPTVATAVADNDTGYATGDQVYDYIEAMAISDATINALFPSTPSV